MPTIKTHASVAISEDARRILKAAYGKAIAHVPGKSEQWLMCVFDGDAPIYMGGKRFRAKRAYRGERFLHGARCPRALGRP